MTLAELEPYIKNGILKFICPKCRTHSFRVPLGNPPNGWMIYGELPNITVQPSIDARESTGGCCHFSIIGGQIIFS